MMLHRFWVTLLLAAQIAMVLTQTGNCKNSKIIGNYSKLGKSHALTISPTGDRPLPIPINKKIDKASTTGDRGIQIYVTLDEDADCDKKELINGVFWISNDTSSVQRCRVEYLWNREKKELKINDKPYNVDYEKPYQASIEVRKSDNSKYKVYSGTAKDGIEVDPKQDPKESCFLEKTQDTISFYIIFTELSACGGVQLEMKGGYEWDRDKDCKASETTPTGMTPTGTLPSGMTPTGTGSTTPETPTTMQTATTTTASSSSNEWIIALVVIIVIILLVIIVIVIVFIVRRRKAEPDAEQGKPEENEEDKTAKEAEENEEDKTAKEAEENEEDKTAEEAG